MPIEAVIILVIFFGLCSLAFKSKKRAKKTRQKQRMEKVWQEAESLDIQQDDDEDETSTAPNPQQIGRRGETLVKAEIICNLPKDQYYQMDDVTLDLGDQYTQIDHIIVSLNGIFVIETKHIKGWIFANPQSKIWVQMLFGHKYKFNNPLRQNSWHITALQRVTKLPRTCFHSIITFTAYPEFKTNIPENILELEELIPYVKTKQKHIINRKTAREAILKIKAARMIKGENTDEMHRNNLNKQN